MINFLIRKMTCILYISYLAGGTTSNNLLQRETAIAHLERLEPGIIFII